MTYFSCFDRLGITIPRTYYLTGKLSSSFPISTTDVKKAYHQLALKTHPDKVPATQKEEATQRFRELHEAYKEALSIVLKKYTNTNDDEDNNKRQYSSYDDHGHTTTRQQGSSSDDDIKKVFEDICKDVDRAAESKEDQEKEECFRCVKASWSTRTCSTENEKRQACWELMNAVFFFTPNFLFESNNDIVTAAKMFEARSPDQLSGLTVYIAQCCSRSKQKFGQKRNKKNTEWAGKINREWSQQQAELLKKQMIQDILPSQFDEIASLVHNSTVAQSIRNWKKEQVAETERWSKGYMLQRAINQQKSADQIVEVFPDKNEIANIIQKHTKFERDTIYKLLPVHIRKILTAGIGVGRDEISTSRYNRNKHRNDLSSAKVPMFQSICDFVTSPTFEIVCFLILGAVMIGQILYMITSAVGPTCTMLGSLILGVCIAHILDMCD